MAEVQSLVLHSRALLAAPNSPSLPSASASPREAHSSRPAEKVTFDKLNGEGVGQKT